MAKPKSSPTVGEPGDIDPQDRRTPMEREAELQEGKILELLRSEQLIGGTVALKRRTIGEAEFAHLAEIAAENFSVENVRQIYGGGDYKAQFKNNGKFVASYAFKVDHRIPPVYPGMVQPGAHAEREDRTPEIISAVTSAVKSSLPPPAPPPDNSLFLEMLRQQSEQNKNMMQLIVAAVTQKPAAPDPMLTEVLRELRDLKSAGNRGGGDSFQKTLENARALQELAGGGGGGGGDDAKPPKRDRVTALIDALAPALPGILAAMQGRGGDQPMPFPPPGPAAQPALADPGALLNPPAPAAAPPPTPPPHDLAMNPLVTAYLSRFRVLAVQAAMKARNAAEWADAKLDDIPENFHEGIFKIANDEQWFAKIFAADPEAQKHFAWLLAMRNGILTRWLVLDVLAAQNTAPRPAAKDYAVALLDRASVSFHDHVWDLLDVTVWPQLFTNYPAADQLWIEQVREALDNEMAGEEAEDEKIPGTVAAETISDADRKKGADASPDSATGGGQLPPAKKSPRKSAAHA